MICRDKRDQSNVVDGGEGTTVVTEVMLRYLSVEWRRLST